MQVTDMDNRITLLFPITDLSRDGAQRQIFELIKGLDKEKFRPFILTLNSGGSMENDFQNIPGLDIITVDKRGKYDLFCLFRVFNKMRRLKAEVVQPFLTPATFYGLLPALGCRTPLIIVTERNASGRKDLGLGTRWYVRLEDLFSRFADWAIPNSEAGRSSLIQRGINSNRIRVIYNGLNFQRLKTDPAIVRQIRMKYNLLPQYKVVGMMARFFPLKNHPAFFHMAEIVSRVLPSVRFALLGDGPLLYEMEDLCARQELSLKTTFFGEQHDVGAYLSIFDVAVLTSDAEGCSNSLLEAMSLGKPVVATDVGGNREIISSGLNGLLVPSGDIQAMAERVIQLLQDPDKACAMGEKARESVISKFSVEKMVYEYESLYESSLRQKIGYKKKELIINEQ
jgi:glycosyltransferase involved in cell wall biosynthesis